MGIAGLAGVFVTEGVNITTSVLSGLLLLGMALGVAHQALLPRLQEVLAPSVIQVRRDPLPAAQGGDAGLTSQPLENDPHLLLRRVLLARDLADRPNGGFDALLLLGHSASRFAILGPRSVA